jgi:hypothetical protein
MFFTRPSKSRVMKTVLYMLLIWALTLPVFAIGEKVPILPGNMGWVEGLSEEPVIMNWIKTDEHGDFDKFTHIMVQSYPREKKLEKYINEGPLDKNNCRLVKGGDAGEWTQLWCMDNAYVNVLVYKGKVEEVEVVKPMILKWMIDG